MFIAALSRIDKIWKQPKCLNGYMDKEDVVYTHTHTHTHTWIDTQKDTTKL